jgi:DNA sulfur modification protein DndB
MHDTFMPVKIDPAPHMEHAFEYVFPAIRGIQAGREFYVSMCPLRLIPKLFLFNEAELIPELRAQRQLNRSRLPEIARYIASNRETYVFSAITVSVDAEIRFVTAPDSAALGVLHIPMSARFIINDGQHRRAAIEIALKECPGLADESISVVFFMDRGLARCQQMFADLNRYAIRPSRSISVLYDHRDEKALLAKLIVSRLPKLKDLVELEKTSLSPGSKALFTLSALCTATTALLANLDLGDERDEVVVSFWDEVFGHMKAWQQVQSGQLTAGKFRDEFLHAHGVVLHALGRVGNSVIANPDLKPKLKGLRKINWTRKCPDWEGRTTIGGTVTKGGKSVLLTTILIKQRLGIPLTADELRADSGTERAKRAA